MHILGFIASHYMGSYGRESLLSIRDHCDKVYICHSIGTSQGFPAQSDPPETAYEIRKLAEEVLGNKLIWEEYPGFSTEQEHRNMKYKHTLSYNYCLSADWDEVMVGIPEAINYAEKYPQRFFGSNAYMHFIKGTEYYFQDIENAPIRLEKLTAANTDQNLNMPLGVFHLSLSQSPELMAYKINVFGHRDEVHPDFMRKWLEWEPAKINEITYLHPTTPSIWHKPTKFLGELPAALKNYKPKIKMKKKVLLIPLDFQRHKDNPELFTDMLNSFLLQTDAMLYQGDISVAIDFKPDIILFQGSMSVADCIVLKRETRALFCMMSGDCRYAPMQSLIEYKEIVDAYFLPFSGELLNTYITLLGKPCHFLWEFIQNWRFKTPIMMEEGYTTFVGNRYDNLPGIEGRDDLFWIMEKDERVKCWGNGFPLGELPNNKVPDVYNNSYIVIAENNHTVENYFTPRNIGGLASGSCVLMKHFQGIEKFFQNLVHTIVYKNKYELLGWLEFLNNNPSVRNTIASQGYGLACINFTMDNWVSELMKIINKYYLKQ